MTKKIATVGDNCIDYYTETGDYYPGGNPVNVAVYIKRLGGWSSYTGVVGNDYYGDFLRKALEDKKVDISHLRTLVGPTALTEVKLIDGDRFLGDYDEGVLEQFELSDGDIDFLTSHDLIVSGIWGKIEAYLEKFKSYGKPLAFDFADKLDHEITNNHIQFVDYAFFSMEEDDLAIIKDFMRKIHSKGPSFVIVTRGEKGSIAFDGKHFYEEGIVKTNVMDTMGAGDSYIAGFLYAHINGKSIPEAMRLGATSSSVTLEYFGAW